MNFWKFLILICLQCHISNHGLAQKNQLYRHLIDVRSYIFELTVSDAHDTLFAKATIRFTVLAGTKDISFDLVSRKINGRGMKVISVHEVNQTVSSTHINDVLRCSFLTRLKPGTEKIITINYKGIPADGLIISKNKYNKRTFFADNWPDRAHHWLPCIDHPSDKASVEFVVRAPAHYQVIANGIQIEESNLNANEKLTSFRELIPLPMKVAVVGIADFAVQQAGEVEGIPVQSWVYPEDRVKGFYDYEQAVEILPFFISRIGPYPFKKLANVQSKTIFGGMENAGAIFYSENSVTGKRDMEALLAHEIAHQWFGNMATESHWSHIWLSEGFATYLAHLYLEQKYGSDTLKKSMSLERQTVLAFTKRKTGPVVDTSVTNFMDLLNANSYQKGAWILHMLRTVVGDTIFWKGLRTYYGLYTGKNASTDNFRKVMEDVSGIDLGQFFKQWLYKTGHPLLSVTWNYNASLRSLSVTITQQQKYLFHFPLTIQVHSGDGIINKTFSISQQQTILAIHSALKPGNVSIDPNVQLLFDGTIREK